MKPRLDHLIKKPFPYTTAEQSQEPGYLAGRFREITSTLPKRQFNSQGEINHVAV